MIMLAMFIIASITGILFSEELYTNIIKLSVGLSCYDPDNPLPMDELIRIADEKMYDEKKNKK